jgi:Uma2 family endonuclease
MTTTAEIYRHLRELRDQFIPPVGMSWPEISGGQWVMMMSPRPSHQVVVKDISVQLDPQLPAGHYTYESTDAEAVAVGKLRVPDLIVTSRAAMLRSGALDPHEILLAIEVVSPSNPENDYEGKVRDYPQMGIAHYLIVDPRDRTWTHHWNIGKADGRAVYENRQHEVWSTPVAVATEQGTWTLETAALPSYADREDVE